ncbi:hypothetical protein AH156_20150 [Salmonella enterica subsp. enterica serovar Enteritidis]|nr:hypothetical protein [Salmonella enterica subsp. enterica serovar Enteritidis]
MEKWVSVFESKGYQVCAEKGITAGQPSIIFRMHKDGGELRSQMVVQATSMAEMPAAVAERDNIFAQVNQELVDGVVDHLMEMEPDLMDGSKHAFTVE